MGGLTTGRLLWRHARTWVEALLQLGHAGDGLEVVDQALRALAQAAVVDHVPARLEQQQVVERLRATMEGFPKFTSSGFPLRCLRTWLKQGRESEWFTACGTPGVHALVRMVQRRWAPGDRAHAGAPPTSKMSMEGWWMVHTTVRPVLTVLRTVRITMAAARASRPLVGSS